MFASTVTNARCQLYTVMRTDLTTYERIELTYPRTDYWTAIKRARDYQATFDPDMEFYDYRVAMCS